MAAVRLKRGIYNALEGPGPGDAPARRVRVVLLAVMLVAITVAILETEPTIRLDPAVAPVLRWLNVGFAAIFLAEFLVRLWVAGEDPRHRGLRGRFRYLLRPLTLLDLAALIPCLLVVGLSDSYLLRLARLLRLVMLLRLARFTRAWRVLADALIERRFELGMSMVLAFGLLLGSATLLHFLERSAQPDAFGSIPRALWWAVTTLTTVGYGDTVPITALGRAVAAVAALMAIGVIAIPTGILAAAFSEGLHRQRRTAERQRRARAYRRMSSAPAALLTQEDTDPPHDRPPVR